MAAPPVLVTRPGKRGDVLSAAFAGVGWPVERIEVIRLEPLPETPETRSAMLDIDNFQRVLVISPTAAEWLAEAVDRYWPQPPVGLAYYAVGAATAAILHERLGVRVHLPASEAGEDTSEALLELASLQSLQDHRVLLVAGEGGRHLLADTLVARGARITRLAVYRRVTLEPSPAIKSHLARGDFQALVVSSGEILEHLARWCGNAALNQPLIVSSARLATLADKLGFRAPVVAFGATPAALTAAVAAACDPEDADVDQDDLEKG